MDGTLQQKAARCYKNLADKAAATTAAQSANSDSGSDSGSESASIDEPQRAKFCTFCGARLPVEANFCSSCGAAVQTAPPPAVATGGGAASGADEQVSVEQLAEISPERSRDEPVAVPASHGGDVGATMECLATSPPPTNEGAASDAQNTNEMAYSDPEERLAKPDLADSQAADDAQQADTCEQLEEQLAADGTDSEIGRCVTVQAPPGKLGVNFTERQYAGGHVVSRVKQESPLFGKVLPGDIIMRIDGENTSALNHVERSARRSSSRRRPRA